MSYHVHLQKFEGPLGLLLYLIRKEEMDIFDININEITKQYLDYIRMMKELDLEVAGDFVAMAATLLHIKSRMLLPQYNEEGEIVETEDPRKELVQQLLDFQRYRDAGKKLYDRPLLNRDLFPRGIRESMRLDEELGEIILEEDGLFSLISAYRKAVRKMNKAVHKVKAKAQSIGSRIMELKDRLIPGRRLVFSELISEGGVAQRVQILITFLSLLELGRMGFVSLFQSEAYADIHIDVKKVVERNVLERVQEFEADDTETVARRMVDIAERESQEASVEVAQSFEPAALSLAELAGSLDVSEKLNVVQASESQENFQLELLAQTPETPVVGEAQETLLTEPLSESFLIDSELEAELQMAEQEAGLLDDSSSLLVELKDIETESFAAVEMATDDDIFAAELELEAMEIDGPDEIGENMTTSSVSEENLTLETSGYEEIRGLRDGEKEV